ncbi:hypothetical protein BTW15_02620 [Pseudomonas syringae pv. tomato]|uniref:Lipoprotein n=1 Tax=Pseudomonas syringae pv. tomato TaxID=323 RepID=A0AB36KYR8_PSEUB|nr:hypothetical protein BTW15_02620 [Pseudomonas syringae pv. tomato]RMU93854.1 hypothetical protein ALP19_04075 [Pseudomonas syringae pv. tomato]TES58916.1 hypothetical protein E2N91_11770 [Pseudomonas syringae pv. tomato]TES79744.1 hypothetical protein E2N89_05935 [Pseudomonas syringae pv. tomato]
MRIALIILAVALAGCASKTPPKLDDAAQAILDRPMPTSEQQRLWECAGTTQTLLSLPKLFKMQGHPLDWGGYIWAISERARRLGCSKAEMDAPDQGRWSSKSSSNQVKP